MGVLDFLFEGSPPPSTTTYGTTVENMPQWLSDYTQALIARSNAIAAEPYQAYQGPRVAGFTDDQTNAFDIIRNNIGNWNDEFNASEDLTKGATGAGAVTQAMPFLQQGAAGYNSLTDPAGSSMTAASPYMTAAGKTFPGSVDQYMDPYVQNVIDREKQEAMRTWNEDLMPGISGRFIRGGQSGSTAHQELMQRGARDVTEGVQSKADAALSDAYKNAGTLFNQDANRMAGLAGTAGSLASSDRASREAAASGLAGIGKDVGSLGLQQSQQQLAAGQQLSGLAQLQQSMAGRDATSLQAVGDTKQQQTQKNLDLAYGDFQNQRDYPKQQADWMSSIIRGMPHDTSTSTTSTGPASVYQPSPMSQLISLYGLYKDVTKAEGGVVHIPGPVGGYDRYGKGGLAHYYAEGGKVQALKGLSDAIRKIAGGDTVYQDVLDDELRSAIEKHTKRPVKRARGGLAVVGY